MKVFAVSWKMLFEKKFFYKSATIPLRVDAKTLNQRKSLYFMVKLPKLILLY